MHFIIPGKYELIMWISYLSKFRLYINIFVVNNYHIIPMNNFIAIMVSQSFLVNKLREKSLWLERIIGVLLILISMRVFIEPMAG